MVANYAEDTSESGSSGDQTPSSTNLGEISPDKEVFIAVMGMTGAGKSSFIQKVTDEEVKIGHGADACTTSVKAYPCHCWSGKTIWLVDTPGFDDAVRSDTEVLQLIAAWLTSTYMEQKKLRGILYLHPITDIRMRGSARKNLAMFQKLCGVDAFKHVVLVTTMWGRVETNQADKQEAELCQRPDLWGWMISKGSQVKRHTNTRESAEALLKLFFSSKSADATLAIQSQMVDHKKSLAETPAGMAVGEWLKKDMEDARNQLKHLCKEMKEARALRDREHQLYIREEKKKWKQEAERVEHDLVILKQDLIARQQRALEELDKDRRREDDKFREPRYQRNREERDQRHQREMQIEMRYRKNPGDRDRLDRAERGVRHHSKEKRYKENPKGTSRALKGIAAIGGGLAVGGVTLSTTTAIAAATLIGIAAQAIDEKTRD